LLGARSKTGAKHRKRVPPHGNAQKGNWTGTKNAQKKTGTENDLHEAHFFLGLIWCSLSPGS
jgi:hypothetical protein